MVVNMFNISSNVPPPHSAFRFTHDFTLMCHWILLPLLWPAWHSPLMGEKIGMPESRGLSLGRGRARITGICNSRAPISRPRTVNLTRGQRQAVTSLSPKAWSQLMCESFALFQPDLDSLGAKSLEMELQKQHYPLLPLSRSKSVLWALK